MAEITEFDVAIIGGWGGAHAARYLAAEGLKVALVEDRLIGGECHYWACNPTKTLLRPIEVLALAKAVPGVRETVNRDKPDLAAVFAKRDAVIDHLSDDAAVAGLKAACPHLLLRAGVDGPVRRRGRLYRRHEGLMASAAGQRNHWLRGAKR